MKKKILLVLVLALLLTSLSACAEKPKFYTVTFDLNGGTLVSGKTTQTVLEGTSAVPPEVEMDKHSLTWVGNYNNVMGNVVITAQWTSTQMSSREVAAYTEKAVVTVHASGKNWEGSGSGFFIDEEGTLVTNYHVIEGARSISVSVMGGGSYNVTEVVGLSPVYDLAVLKIDYQSRDYLAVNLDASIGEQVYAVGSALGELDGSFTSGTLSALNRSYGVIQCYQMDAAISPGNSGGPLVNAYGEVIGICSYSYVEGQNNNLAIKISQLDKLDLTKHYTVNQFLEWYDRETARSYSPWDDDLDYFYSVVNRYEIINKGATCLASVYQDKYGDLDYEDGFVDCCQAYCYDYTPSEYDAYVDYLTSCGFEYNANVSEENDYYYSNIFMGITINLEIETSDDILFIYPLEGT